MEEILAFIYGCLLAYFCLTQDYHETSDRLWYLGFSIIYLFIGYLIALIDFEFLLIPTEAIFSFISLGLLETYFFSDTLYIDLMIAFFWMSLFWLIRILSRYKMGFADVILIFALSLGLFYPQQLSLPTLASLIGIIFYLVKKIHFKKMRKNIKLPFGSFLVISFLLLRLIPKAFFSIQR